MGHGTEVVKVILYFTTVSVTSTGNSTQQAARLSHHDGISLPYTPQCQVNFDKR